MKTITYNPSILEVKFADAIERLRESIEDQLGNYTILELEKMDQVDNPAIKFKLTDKDGDAHEVVIRVIQRSDEVVNPV